MDTLYYILLILFIVLSLFLILLVLIQKGRGGGLASAFGGVGGNTAFGAKTGDVLTWATSIVFGVFLLLGITLNLLANSIQEQHSNPEAPNATQTGAASGGGLIPTVENPSTEPTTTEPATLPAVEPPSTSEAATPPTTQP